MLVSGLGAVAMGQAQAAPDGQLAAWGLGIAGQRGDGSTAPTMIQAVSVVSTGALAGRTIVQVDAGVSHSCAVAADGLLACWGANDYGQLGNGLTGNQPTPTPQAVTGGILAGKQVVQVAAGYRHTCALTKDGILACWGDASQGELGNQPSASSAVPVAVFTGGTLAGRAVTQVSAGVDYTCAVASGAVTCWGDNLQGQLGDTSTTDRPIPVVTNASAGSALLGRTVTDVSAGFDHVCARSSDGSLACWGSNGSQQAFPSATLKKTAVPTLVDQGALAGRQVTQVSAGREFTCAVASGSVVCWGANDVAQMANGPASNTPQAIPALATTASPSALAGKTLTMVSSGAAHACAVATDGSLACWGSAESGALGTAGPASRSVPWSVTGPPGSGVMSGAIARSVTSGARFTIALTSSLPDPPTGITSVPGDALATVSWTAPKVTGGSPITSFVVQLSTDAGSTWTAATGSPVAATSTSLVVPNLANGVNVTFRVAAATAAGQGAYSGPTSVVRPAQGTPTAPPSAPVVTKPGAVQGLVGRSPRSRVVVLTWQPPVTGTVPSSYQLRRKQDGHRYSAWTSVTPSTLTIRHLKKGKKYSFAVRAANAAGFGPGTVVTLTVR
jgi:alpha-tubulin suppressor-like RCC1 family protein